MSQTQSTQNPTTRKVGDVKSNELVLEAIDELHIALPDRRRKPKPLSETEARDLTIDIRRTSVRLWILVVEAHDRGAHTALGYETWADYVQAELKMSPSRSYQLLDTGHVMKELAIAGVDMDTQEPPPTRVVARVKDRLSDVRKVAEAAVKKGEPVDTALRGLAREPRRTRARGEPEAAAEGPAAEVPTTGKTEEPSGEAPGPRSTVKCPACGGSGQVDRSLAGKLRGFLSSL